MILKFQATIPPLTDEEFRQLEQNILADGIRDPLVVWGKVLVVKSRTYIPRLPFINFIKGGLPSDSIVR